MGRRADTANRLGRDLTAATAEAGRHAERVDRLERDLAAAARAEREAERVDWLLARLGPEPDELGPDEPASGS